MKTSARYLRAPIAWAGDTTPPVVDHERKVITGYAVITPGEALGHGMWIDQSFVHDVAQLGNQKPEGIKVRMTHPGLSADGMGKHLGRAKNFRMDETGVCRADLHFHKKATGPRADMIDDVMSLAEEDPKAFGSSIVFMRDESAEKLFVESHTSDDGFVSPDPANAKNLSHARIAQLRASDIVDEPAANPNGFLSDNEEFAARAEAILNYTLHVTDDAPDVLVLGDLPPEKLRAFFAGYLERHELTVIPTAHIDELMDRLHTAETKAVLAAVEVQSVPLATAVAEALQAVTCPQCGCEFEPEDDGEEAEPGETEPEDDAQPMAAPIGEMVEQFGAISYGHAHPDGTPLAPKAEAWDGPSNVTAASVDDLRIMCTWVDAERQELKTAYKLPHHKATDGHSCVWRGVAQAASRLPQAFMPESDRPGCRAHLGRHYHEFDEQPPWERNAAGWALYEQFCVQVQQRGGVQDGELAMVLRSLGFTPEADALVTVGPLGGDAPLPDPPVPPQVVEPTVPEPAPMDTASDRLSAEEMQALLAAVEHSMEQKLMTVTGRLPRKLRS